MSKKARFIKASAVTVAAASMVCAAHMPVLAAPGAAPRQTVPTLEEPYQTNRDIKEMKSMKKKTNLLKACVLTLAAATTVCVAHMPAIAAVTSSSSAASSEAVSTLDALLEKLYQAKARDEALDVEEDILKDQYRAGKLSVTDYTSKSAALRTQEDALDLEENMIKMDLYKQGWMGRSTASYATHSLEDLIKKHNELEIRDSALDIQMDQLETQYRLGQVTREDFITQTAALKKQEDAIEQEEDPIEHELERRGWDD